MRLLTLLGLVACTAEGTDAPVETDAPTLDEDAVAEVLATYADIARAAYGDARVGAQSIDASIAQLVQAPDARRLADARDTWLAAREPYLFTEVMRFYGGPIDAEAPPGPEPRINSWPLDEVYLDYVADPLNPGVPRVGGIINDEATFGPITAEALIAWNQPQSVGETAVAAGYHAIEFLLWGQDLSDEGPGARPFTDFIDGAGPGRPDRRREFLAASSALLVQDLSIVADAWEPGSAWRAEWDTLAAEPGLLKLLTGMGSLSGAELAGERMQVAYDSQSQEDEHSCFSDNTRRDILGDLEGIRGVYQGRYVRADGSVVVEGASLHDLVAEVDPALADGLAAALDDTIAKAGQIGVFDRDIVTPEGRERVAAVIAALGVQTGLIVDVATTLGVRLNLED